jgi:hypothetical protein
MLCLQDRDFFDHRPVRDLRWLAILTSWLAISVLAAFQPVLAGAWTHHLPPACKGLEAAPQGTGESPPASVSEFIEA